MRLDLNLASEPFVNRTPQALLVGALFTAAAALTAWNVTTIVRSVSEAKAVEGQLASLKSEEERLKREGEALQQRLDRVDVRPLQLRAAAANEVLAEKALSWSLLLDRLEELLPWDAALRSVDASVGSAGVKLTMRVRARDQEQLLDLLDALEASPCFSEAYPGDEKPLGNGEFDASVTVDHDPYCGNAPQIPGGLKARGSMRRGARRG